MRKIKCDNINVKILLNENDFLKKEITRLKSELWQIHSETNALHTVTMPILKDRIAWHDEENKNKINNLEKKLQKVRKETAEKYHNEIELLIRTCMCMHYISLEHGRWFLNDNDKLAKSLGVEIKEN